MAKKIKDNGDWFVAELDNSDTPDDLEIPYSELAMHTGDAGKFIKPKKIECSKKGYVIGIKQADVINPKTKKVEYEHMHGLMGELIPFQNKADFEKIKKVFQEEPDFQKVHQKLDTMNIKDQKKALDDICQKLS